MSRSPTTRGPRRMIGLYRALLTCELTAAAAYRAQLMLTALGWLAPIAFLALWRGAAAGGSVQGITAVQFATYFCLLLATSNLQVTMPMIFGIGGLIYHGKLSALLLRPCHPIHTEVARAYAEKCYRLVPLVALVPAALVLTGGAVGSVPADWLLAVVVCLLGTAGVTYLGALAGTVAFWMTKAQGVQGLLVALEWVVGGVVAPVPLLPAGVVAVAQHQPLWFANGAAPEILSGIGQHSWWLVVEGTAWVVVLHLVLAVVWRRGLARFDAVGA